MGQTEHKKTEEEEKLKHTIEYFLDFRMLEHCVELPSCLSYNTQKLI